MGLRQSDYERMRYSLRTIESVEEGLLLIRALLVRFQYLVCAEQSRR